uniref:Uncharacterized protein n=1 Tax=Anguilla anguilla TaxID=7936 RepID=A0A0E9WW61_ANGAN
MCSWARTSKRRSGFLLDVSWRMFSMRMCLGLRPTPESSHHGPQIHLKHSSEIPGIEDRNKKSHKEPGSLMPSPPLSLLKWY